LNEFISFWFETRVDDVLKYETTLDIPNYEWCVCKTGEQATLLEGKWDSNLSEDKIIDSIAPLVEAAIKEGRI